MINILHILKAEGAHIRENQSLTLNKINNRKMIFSNSPNKKNTLDGILSFQILIHRESSVTLGSRNSLQDLIEKTLIFGMISSHIVFHLSPQMKGVNSSKNECISSSSQSFNLLCKSTFQTPPSPIGTQQSTTLASSSLAR